MRNTTLKIVIPMLLLTSLQVALAEPESCQTVRTSDPGWTDINATNAISGVLLEGLGYRQQVSNLSVPVGFQGLKSGQVDVFLGNWLPAQQPVLDKFADGIEKLGTNLASAKFTLVVPDYVAAAGVKSFQDLARYGDRFERKIYGIAAGSPANQNISKLLKDPAFALDGWSLVESSETGMLTQADRAIKQQKWVVFLGWEPHVMNAHYKLVYLSGGDNYFGPNYGSATVNTLARKGWAAECPNVARLFANLKFDVALENNIIKRILDDKQTASEAARAELKAHPEYLASWLAGVTTFAGQPAQAAVTAAINP